MHPTRVAAALAAAFFTGVMTAMAVAGCGSDPDLYDREPVTTGAPGCAELNTPPTDRCDGQ